jgi:broad specificity phosphatase PhoE
MTKIILVRHGETIWNKTRRIHGGSMDIPLSEKGLLQAECLAKRLDEDKVQVIYSSPQQRALATAGVIAEHKKLKVNIEPDLREIEAGELEGVEVKKLDRRFSQILTLDGEAEDFPKLPGGESIEEVQQRAWAVVQRIMKKHPDKTVAVVSHYFTMLAIICTVLGMPLSNIGRLKLANASLSYFEHKDNIFRLMALNELCSEWDKDAL